jgi:hypothetical protein
MSEVSTFRLYLLRAMYVYMAVGLLIFKLVPGILQPETLSVPGSVGPQSALFSVLAGFALLAVLGIRYPVKMLPLLFLEFVWKSIWLLAFGLSLVLSGRLDPVTTETLTGVLMGVVLVPLVMPWGYVLKHYVRVPGDRWGKQVTARASESTNPVYQP